jgi:hypothetical protein
MDAAAGNGDESMSDADDLWQGTGMEIICFASDLQNRSRGLHECGLNLHVWNPLWAILPVQGEEEEEEEEEEVYLVLCPWNSLQNQI